MPNLIEFSALLTTSSSSWETECGRGDEGLEAVFRQVFPIKDFSNLARICRIISRIPNTTSRSASSAP